MTMVITGTQLSGPQKAAVAMAQADRQHVAQIVDLMSDSEVLELVTAMATLPAVDPDEVELVVGELRQASSQAPAPFRHDPAVTARLLLAERFGPERADEVFTKIVTTAQPHPLNFLQNVDPSQMAGFLTDEHPQIVAAVLAHLQPEHAAQVLGYLGDPLRTDVVHRIAKIRPIAPEVVTLLAEVLQETLSKMLVAGITQGPQIGGVKTVVGILNNGEVATEKAILTRLDTDDPELAEEIRSAMFVFQDVAQLDDRTLQLVLRHITLRDIAVALKGVTEDVKQKFLANLSTRAAEDLVEEIDLLGPTKVTSVEAAQRAIAKTVRQLENDGEIELARRTDEFVT